MLIAQVNLKVYEESMGKKGGKGEAEFHNNGWKNLMNLLSLRFEFPSAATFDSNII